MIQKRFLKPLRVESGEDAGLSRRRTDWSFSDELKEIGKDRLKERAHVILDQNRADLAEAQDALYAAGSHAVLVVLQAMDAAGKDGTIKHVMSGVNPQGCQVSAFKQPSSEERAHDFLWRYTARLPRLGMIGIFNRSHYEDVLVVRVHPEYLGPAGPKPGKAADKFWNARYKDINAFERHLARNGTVILKFFLHISKDEQRRRLLARLDDPAKHWKFSAGDLAERDRWDDYMAAFEAALTATSTKWAPWYVIPADHKWAARAAVADILTQTIRKLGVKPPTLSPDEEAALQEARKRLET